MTMFWLASSFLVLLGLIIIWYTFIREVKSPLITNGNIRNNTNISLYHEHLRELENDLKEGAIEQTSFELLKAELSKTLLQDVDNQDIIINGQVNRKTTSLFWAIGISLFIAVVSFYTYFQIGASEQLALPKVATKANPHANLNMEQMALFKVQQLQQKVAAQPDNSQAWFSLGQAYIGVGQFDEAVRSFDQVITLIGEYAELIGPKAQALYYKNNEQMNDEISALIDKALALDPVDASTNILLGMDAYAHNNYAVAIEHWEKVLDSGRPGINTQALVGAVNEAKSQLAMSGGPAVTATESNNIALDSPKLSISLSFSEQILNKLMLTEDKIVFVYALVNESKIPLAAVKIFASEIPTTVILDDSLAMTVQKLSSVEKVNLFAVVSMRGNVGIKAGDYKAELFDVSVNQKEVIQLTIDTEVKN